uniref:(California timema) hypothetical protein n=1 Tax=Timema californicum TaxID=61474 RepID=A0A7R9JCE3_TIMCA|nr:unnamed protein product [Timema californicum]
MITASSISPDSTINHTKTVNIYRSLQHVVFLHITTRRPKKTQGGYGFDWCAHAYKPCYYHYNLANGYNSQRFVK